MSVNTSRNNDSCSGGNSGGAEELIGSGFSSQATAILGCQVYRSSLWRNSRKSDGNRPVRQLTMPCIKISAMAKRSEQTVEIEGRQLTLSNLDKVLYPAVGFTKGQ